MKIALFTETYEPQKNGVVVFLSTLIPLLTKEHQVILFTPGEKKLTIDPKSPNFKVIHVPGRPFPFYKGYSMAKLSFLDIYKIMEREKVDIAYLHIPVNLGIQGLAAAKLLRIPTIATYHTHLPDYFPHLTKGKLTVFEPVYKKTTTELIRRIYSNFDVVTSPSREFLHILKKYGLKNVVYLPNGINHQKFRREYLQKFDGILFEKYNIQKNVRIISYIGRISFEKKLEILLKAYKILERKYINLLLIIAGDGPYIEKYKELAKKLEIRNIIFTGFVTDEMLRSIYYNTEIFASPSDTETSGLTFLEAMTAGLPVVGVRSGGVIDYVKDFSNGFLVEKGDPKHFAIAIDKLLLDPQLCANIRKNNILKSNEFSIENTYTKLMFIYGKMLKNKEIVKNSDLRLFPKVLNITIEELISLNRVITWQKRKLQNLLQKRKM
ncbi:MAG: glycosyltransferase [Candidatus Micrarchaeota archaeon]